MYVCISVCISVCVSTYFIFMIVAVWVQQALQASNCDHSKKGRTSRQTDRWIRQSRGTKRGGASG